ncbi:MAG: LTA synthase family protein [Dysgonomonas sp.]
MNVSRVYFSENMYLNHSAINPLFNILYSLKLNTDLSSEYHFMDDGQAQLTFNRLMEHDKGAEVPELLKTDRPNIIFVILESFGANIIEPLGGVKDVAPNMNKLTEEGIFFRNLYVSSFRTDRGIVATLGGYPAQPTMSILKYPKKVQALNSIPKSLVDNGYSASFLYGGDVNFAQMKTFFVTQKVTDITTDTDFPIKDRLTKWGVPDAITFEKFYEDIKNEQSKPYLKMFLTLSSHEPFDVPTKRFEEPFLNSVAYTDSCIGVFVDKLKSSPDWNNTLIIFIPDHCMRYPKTVEYNEPERHQSFSLWIGGALKDTLKIDKCCSQIDMVATLLHQLHIDHKDFIFSKNVLNPTTKDFAFYSFSDGFGMLSDSSQVVYDNNSKQVIMSKGIHADSLLLEGKAFLQYLYRDIDSK